jgi:dynein heavy chain 1, cytosolic
MIATSYPSSACTIIDINSFIFYLKTLLNALWDNDENEQTDEALDKIINEKHSLELIKSFLSDDNVNVLFIRKHGNDGESDNNNNNVYSISITVLYDETTIDGIILIKNDKTIKVGKKISSQLRVVSLNDNNTNNNNKNDNTNANKTPYDNVYSLLTNAISPFIKSYQKKKENMMTSHQNEDGQPSTVVEKSIEKRLTDLELDLFNLNCNQGIPQCHLTINPTVLTIIEKFESNNGRRSMTIQDIDANLLNDSNFLNQLQSGVNKWIQQIKDITNINDKGDAATTYHEVNFWLNLEKSLIKLKEKCESLEVNLTLDILKYGKRFHATVSFNTDAAGLKQTLDIVKDYNFLMRDFPINDLLTSIELPKISDSLQAIFLHLKKIRSCKYPIDRFYKLIELISKDFYNQMMKVLMNKKLMHYNYDLFENNLASIFEIFKFWDSEYEKIIMFLIDLKRKQRLTVNTNQSMKVNLNHKQLQSRLEYLRK